MLASFSRGIAVTVVVFCAIGFAYSQQNDQKPNLQTASKLTWVKIQSTGGISGMEVWRTKIPGGWLVTTGFRTQSTNAGSGGSGVTFVHDPDHTWDGGSLE